MTLLDRLNDDLKDAMRARDEHKLSALRLVRAGIKNAEVAKAGSWTRRACSKSSAKR